MTTVDVSGIGAATAVVAGRMMPPATTAADAAAAARVSRRLERLSSRVRVVVFTIPPEVEGTDPCPDASLHPVCPGEALHFQ
ncbi:hypothetical protein ACIBAG_17270 [Streptomyces sp. NPDC051243]|uniref:hypothetical protein n=1 Tax=Streptomyces sp. NPDC051243 TaxID=3365646 RepID=UPI0037906E8F